MISLAQSTYPECPCLYPRIFACLQKRRQKGVLAIETNAYQQVRPIKQRDETGLHRHAMSVFDARGKTMNIHMVFSDFTRKVRQVRKRCHDANF